MYIASMKKTIFSAYGHEQVTNDVPVSPGAVAVIVAVVGRFITTEAANNRSRILDRTSCSIGPDIADFGRTISAKTGTLFSRSHS
jgi:hypothetical protein